MATACITLLIANLCDKYLSVYTHKVDNWNSVYWSRQADDKVRETVAKCVQSRGLWGTVLITAPLEHWFWIHRIVRRQNHDSYMNRFFHAPLVLMAWHQLVLFSKASTWPHPFIACSWGTGVGFFRVCDDIKLTLDVELTLNFGHPMSQPEIELNINILWYCVPRIFNIHGTFFISQMVLYSGKVYFRLLKCLLKGSLRNAKWLFYGKTQWNALLEGVKCVWAICHDWKKNHI